MPVLYKKGRELFDYETELRDLGLDARAERVRDVKCAIYRMTMHCRCRIVPAVAKFLPFSVRLITT